MADKKKTKKTKKMNIGLEATLKAIKKTYGEEAVMRMGDKKNLNIEFISTGSIGLDVALGVGGLPRGRVVEIYGPTGAGKTTLALQVIAEAQRIGGTAAFIDAEHALSPKFARNLGVNTDEMFLSQPDNGEQGLELTDMLVRSGEIDVIVVDSVAALVPKAELDGDMGDQLPGLQARMMGQALRKLTPVVGKSKCIVILINQLRVKIGVMFGSNEVTTGGNALKFYASVRLDVRRKAKIEVDDILIGNRLLVKVVKNKVAAPFAEAEFDLIFSKGIQRTGEILDFAIEHEIFDKSGSWYSYDGEQLGQGRDKTVKFLDEHPEMLAEIEELVIDAI